MIERHVSFNVLPGKEEAFERLFVQEYRPAMSRMPGFVRAELLRDQEDLTQYRMVIRFQSLETAANWRNSDLHQALQPKLKAFYNGSSLKIYDVVA